MNQLNSLILEGYLAKDPVMYEPTANFKVCKFTLGVNRFYKNKNDEGVNEVSYFEVEAYDKSAEICCKIAKKGRGVRVVGRLKQDVWKDKDGKNASKIIVIAEHIEYKPVYAKSDSSSSETEKKQIPVPVVASEKTEEKEAAVF